jgi:tRNA A-37 threonylcarbamoyl transferase component Bud32
MLKQSLKTIKFVKNFKNYKNASSEAEKIKAAKLISSFIQKEGGLFLKAAQYMGTNQDHHKEIEKLSFMKDSGIPFKEVLKILKKGIKNFEQKYIEISEEAFCASVGQVHKAKTTNGEIVAIKVQYPKIEKELKNQLKLLNLIPTGRVEKKWGIDINQYKLMIQRLIDDELDYTKEFNIQREVLSSLDESPFYKIPRLYEEDSGNKIIITEFLEGVGADKLLSYSIKELESLSESLVYTYLTLLKNGYTQADSNHGNFIFKNSQVGLIDFGQFYKFQDCFAKIFISLLYKVIEAKDVDYLSYFCALGFSESKLKIIEKDLGVLSLILFKPFLVNGKMNLDNWNYKHDIDQVLGDNKWWFRSAGGEEFFIILKSFLGFKNLIQKHKVRINWQQIFKEVFIGDKNQYISFHPTKIESKNQCFIGKRLEILIRDGEHITKQELSLLSLFEINDYLGEKIQAKLKSKSIDTERIAKEALANGAPKGILFQLLEDQKEYIVQIL